LNKARLKDKQQPSRHFGKRLLEYLASGMTQEEVLEDFPRIRLQPGLFDVVIARQKATGELCRYCPCVRNELPCFHEGHHHQASRNDPAAIEAGGSSDGTQCR